MEGLAQYGDSDSDNEQLHCSVPGSSVPGTDKRANSQSQVRHGARQDQSMIVPVPEALPSAAALLSQGGISSMHAGDPPTFKRGAPSSAAGRQQGAFGAQKPARRGAAASVTQGRNGAAGANPFLPPQLKGRANVVTEDLDKMGVKRKRGGSQGVTPQQE
ncbi:hypothetical protein CVIRNUC_008945 [Coccomyxa viridis]|uniref:Uncharacterized protein n=1 Tax=Coccomyxa viridis TaxID=1274662 RepID=A0AAV1IIC2_9CHLO|nr:hypothetical protein CVIRNUC_008945 [Coccomyxa viridis]